MRRVIPFVLLALLTGCSGQDPAPSTPLDQGEDLDNHINTSNYTREPECDRCMQPDPYNTDCIKGMDCDECLIIRGNEGGVCHPYGSPFHGPGICESGRCTGATLDMGMPDMDECAPCMQVSSTNRDCAEVIADCKECLLSYKNEGGVCSPYGGEPGFPDVQGVCQRGRCIFDMPLDMGPDCTCSTVDDCCDGCNQINVGAACDDGLDCTIDTTCQDDGTCGGSTGSPCDAQLEHPDCQAAMCDEVAGCSTAPTREGLECSTPEPGTFDGICQAGVCVGQQSCECSIEDGPCCDGCHIQPAGHVCDTAGIAWECDPGCGGDVIANRISFLCDGNSVECTDQRKGIEESRIDCGPSTQCFADPNGSSMPECKEMAECPM